MLTISGADPRPSIPGLRLALDRIKLQGRHERGGSGRSDRRRLVRLS